MVPRSQLNIFPSVPIHEISYFYRYAISDSVCSLYGAQITAKHLPIRDENSVTCKVLPPSSMQIDPNQEARLPSRKFQPGNRPPNQPVQTYQPSNRPLNQPVQTYQPVSTIVYIYCRMLNKLS